MKMERVNYAVKHCGGFAEFTIPLLLQAPHTRFEAVLHSSAKPNQPTFRNY